MPYELYSITSLWLNSAPSLTACLEQISMQYYISTIKFCVRFGIKAPFLKMRTIWGTDFKYSLITLGQKAFLSIVLLCKKKCKIKYFFYELGVSPVIFRNIECQSRDFG